MYKIKRFSRIQYEINQIEFSDRNIKDARETKSNYEKILVIHIVLFMLASKEYPSCNHWSIEIGNFTNDAIYGYKKFISTFLKNKDSIFDEFYKSSQLFSNSIKMKFIAESKKAASEINGVPIKYNDDFIKSDLFLDILKEYESEVKNLVSKTKDVNHPREYTDLIISIKSRYYSKLKKYRQD